MRKLKLEIKVMYYVMYYAIRLQIRVYVEEKIRELYVEDESPEVYTVTLGNSDLIHEAISVRYSEHSTRHIVSAQYI